MKIKLLVLTLIISNALVCAQTKLADKFFKNYGYIKAIELYENAVNDGDNSAHVLTRLGDAYYNNSNSEKAVYWYGKALETHKNIEAEYLYKYIQSLRSIGNYEEADTWFKILSATQKGDSRLKNYNPNDVDLYDKLTSKNKVIVNIKNLAFNSSNSDFGAFVFNNSLYFSSSRNSTGKVYGWNKEPFLDLYQVKFSDNEGNIAYESPMEINAKGINTEYHEAAVAITNDGKTLYFTRDNVNRKNKLQYDKKGTTHLKLYKASFINEQWGNIIELPFNDDLYSSGHPALSPDNKTLYFVSDRKGGFGQTDIYSVAIMDDNSYGEPKNLGASVNTEGREMFPFVSKDNTLYFSSDGYLNLGLLDIFESNILNGDNKTPENMGTPYNSGYDDFGFFVNTDTKQGYFSSNRPNGKGSDDIYSFDARICKEELTGTARDTKTNLPLNNVTVRLIDETGKILQELITNADGTYSFITDCNKTITLVGSKPDYKDDQKTITTSQRHLNVNEVNLMLEPLIIDNQIVINPIFFDFDKWNIRTDAQYELENIVDVLRKHPEMIIKIESHTDSRGGDRYNMKLSDRRAKSTRAYIVSRGIAASRIESAIGYGESQLLNKCANRVPCTEEKHQLNRRSYFYIINK